MESILNAMQIELEGISQLQENICSECKNEEDRALLELYIQLKASSIAKRYAELIAAQKELEQDPVLRQYERSNNIL